MEKIKLQDHEFEVVSILKSGLNLLTIEFLDTLDISGIDKSSVEVFTDGGVRCATLVGYITIYKIDGNKVVLSNDGSVYKISALLVGADGYIVDNIKITEEEMTQFTITEQIGQHFWKPKWNFELLCWEEGGTEPTTQPSVPSQETRIEQLENAVLFIMME